MYKKPFFFVPNCLFIFGNIGDSDDNVFESCQSWIEHGSCLPCSPPGPLVEPYN